jgi:hypothetical protein
MKKNQSQTSSSQPKSDSVSLEREQNSGKPSYSKTLNIAPLNLNALSSSSGNQSESNLEMSNPKASKSSASSQNYEKHYAKVVTFVRDIYLEIKHRIVDEV